MKALLKKLLPLTLFGIAVTSLFSVQPAQAYRVTLEQVGSNVVANGSGPIDLTGLTLLETGSSTASPLEAQLPSNRAGVMPVFAQINTGPTHSGRDIYTGIITGPFVFGGDFAPRRHWQRRLCRNFS